VVADAAQLRTALIELVENARDAMPDGGKLTIETAKASVEEPAPLDDDDSDSRDYVVLSVRDTGDGMSPEIVERAFDPFYSTKDVGKGTGLGLSMVQGFVTQSGGFTQVESEVGNGTALKLCFPQNTDN